MDECSGVGTHVDLVGQLNHDRLCAFLRSAQSEHEAGGWPFSRRLKAVVDGATWGLVPLGASLLDRVRVDDPRSQK